MGDRDQSRSSRVRDFFNRIPLHRSVRRSPRPSSPPVPLEAGSATRTPDLQERRGDGASLSGRKGVLRIPALSPESASYASVAPEEASAHPGTPAIIMGLDGSKEPLYAAEARELAPNTDTPSSTESQRGALWREAYDKLLQENADLLRDSETVLKDQNHLILDGALVDQLAAIASAQRRKVENRQWRLQWREHTITIREAIERILNITQKSTSLISLGMSQAPAYVSIPWSAVSALIPLMMNEFKEHKGCIDGLESVAKIIFSYQLVEATFLRSSSTRDLYKKAVMYLYKMVLEYQVLAIRYFGRSTLRRIGRNVAGLSTEWADMPAKISSIDNETRRALNFLGQRQQISTLTSIHDLLERQDREINKIVQTAKTKSEEVSKITCWISAIPVEMDHRDVRKKLGEAHCLSGRWFINNPSLGLWKRWEDDSRCLWLKGGVGAGKSSLTSILIEELIRSPDGLVAFYYCSRKMDKNCESSHYARRAGTAAQPGRFPKSTCDIIHCVSPWLILCTDERSTARGDPENALRSLLAQVVVSEDGKEVGDGLEKRAGMDPRGALAGLSLSTADCVDALANIFTARLDQRFTIVVDALDECDDPDSLLQALVQVTNPNSNVRLFFSSRFEAQVHDYFPTAFCLTIGVQNTGDIRTFLDIEIPKRRPSSGMTDSQARRLIDTIMARAGGMFMWAKLQVNLFLAEVKAQRIRLEEDVESRLLSLEDSRAIGEDLLYEAYGEVYKTAVGKNEARRREVVIAALKWVLCAFRTLTLRELAFAVSIKPDGTFSSRMEEGLLMEFCSNLLVVDSAGSVRLAHLSVRHFLETRTPPDFVPDLAHRQAALTSLHFMRSSFYEETWRDHRDDIKPKDTGIILTRSFHIYVKAYWSRHCRESRQDEGLQDLMSSVAPPTVAKVGPGQGHESPLQTSPNDLSLSVHSASGPFITSSINRAATWGSEVPVSLPSIPSDNIFDWLYHHAGLPADSESRSEDKFLLEQFVARGGDVNIRNALGHTLLHECIQLGLDSLVKLLLDAGADPGLRDPQDNTSLHLAAMHAGNKAAQFLLRAGANKNATNSNGQTPLHLAVAFGSETVAQILLSADVRMERDLNGDTPMHYAATMNSAVMVESLLLLGHDTRTENNHGESAMAQAKTSDHQEVVNALLRHASVTPQEVLTLPSESESSKDFDYRVDVMGFDSRLCNMCDVARWILGSRHGKTFRHHESAEDLIVSAQHGCPLCRLFCEDLSLSPTGCSGTIIIAERETLEPAVPFTVTLEPSYTQGSRPDRRDRIAVFCGETELLAYELCLHNEHDDSIPREIDWISGRLTDDLPMMENCARKVSSWVHSCLSTHSACGRAHEADANLAFPTRLLDLGTDPDIYFPHVRLIETHSDMRAQYTMLTVHWGRSASGILRTMLSNELEYLESIPWTEITSSLTIMDAVITTRRLGFRYLWVDSLCIIQDSFGHRDWEWEATRLSHYTQGSVFAIVAAGSTIDHGSGLMIPRNPAKLHMSFVADRVGPSSDGTASEAWRASIYLRLPLETAAEALSHTLRRIWAVQEVVLPTRILVVGRDQVYWHCRTLLASEGSSLDLKPFVTLQPRQPTCSRFHVNRTFFPWYALVNSYSHSTSTYPGDDRPLAISEPAQYFDKDSLYLDGLWADDFKNGILWYTDELTPKSYIARANDHSSSCGSVSWSWLSLTEQGVRYNLVLGAQHNIVPPFHALSVLNIDPGDAHNDQGLRSRHAKYAEVSAMVYTPMLSSQKRDFICFFDNVKEKQEWLSLGQDFVFMLVSLWNPTPLHSSDGAFGLGLILRERPRSEPALERTTSEDAPAHSHQYSDNRGEWCCSHGISGERAEAVHWRVGLFLVPDWQSRMDTGTRRTLILR